jgi:hypothetical protein
MVVLGKQVKMPEGTPNLYIFKVLNIGLTEE